MNSFAPNNTTSTFKSSRSALVRREAVYTRTTELALLAGRYSHEIRKSDYDRAKLELTGVSDPELQDLILW